MNSKEAPPGTVFPKGINPFICDRCGKPSDGGIDIKFSAGYGSDWDTIGSCDREICDDCYRVMVPLFKDRLWLGDVGKTKYQDMDKTIQRIKEHQISEGRLPIEEW